MNTVTISIDEYDNLRELRNTLDDKQDKLGKEYQRYSEALRDFYEDELKKITQYEEEISKLNGKVKNLYRDITVLTNRLYFTRFLLGIAVAGIVVGVLVATLT